MIILIAALTLKLDIGNLLGTNKPAPQPVGLTCGIKTVSYRFVGEPGTRFRYDGETFLVPVGGQIELIANRRATEYHFEGRALPLEVWPKDQFGTRTVPLPGKEAGSE